MRALVLDGIGAAVALRDVPAKSAGPGEALVRISAAALNHRDVWIRQGKYAGLKWPIIVGSDGVGTVEAVGDGVDAAWVGRRVVIDPGTGWGDDPRAQGKDYRILGLPEDGTLAEYTKVSATQLVACPEHLTDAEAAALPLGGLTAYRAVVTQGEVGPGARVLVTGIGGGVALFALQIALARGAEVHVTSGDPRKLERARALGAAQGASYEAADWGKALRALAGPGYDVVVDSAGGDGFATLVDLARPGGRIVFFGATLGNPSAIDLRRLFWKQLRLQGTTMGTAAEFRAMVALYAEKKLRPVVDRTFAFAEGEAAFQHMEQGKQFGKIVLVP
jgi:NADPH:quinone reductase-like Zn-dependent oxidoreductase